MAAAAGRDVAYPLLCPVAGLPESDARESLRQAVEQVCSAPIRQPAAFRFRHALLAEAIYTTILPGEREELHARLAEELARAQAASPAELAPHWAAAGEAPEALVASIDCGPAGGGSLRPGGGARTPRAGLGVVGCRVRCVRARRHRPAPSCAPGQPSSPARREQRRGRSSSAHQAVDLVEEGDPLRAVRYYDRLSRYLHESGRTDAALSVVEHVTDLVPAEPPSAERARALAALAQGLMLAWRFDESLAICEQALAIARAVGAEAVEFRALVDLGRDLAYVGRARRGRRAALAGARARRGDGWSRRRPVRARRPHRRADDAGEAERVGTDRGTRPRGRPPYGIDSTVLVANVIEALLAAGEWDEADRESVAALRAITANFPYMLLMLRADLEVGRGDFDAARVAPRSRARHPARGPRAGDLRRLPRRAGSVGAAVDRGRPGGVRRPGDGELPPGRSAPRLVLRQGIARPRGAGSARARPPR